MLEWARQTAGLTVGEAARLCGIDAQRLEVWESGSEVPDREMLFTLADVYMQPLTVFYLNRPPRRNKFGLQFASRCGLSRREQALLEAAFRDISVKQSMLKSLVEDDPDWQPCAVVGKASRCVSEAAPAVREIVGDSLRDRPSSPSVFYARLRSAAESQGIFTLLSPVQQTSTAGSPEWPEQHVFHSCAIADRSAPLVAVNPLIGEAEMPFAFLRGLALLAVEESDVCGPPWPCFPKSESEVLASVAAAEVLMPALSFNVASFPDRDSADQAVEEISSQSSLGVGTVVWRLEDVGMISEKTYRCLLPSAAGSPDTAHNSEHLLGPFAAETVDQALAEGSLTSTKAAIILRAPPGADQLRPSKQT